VGDDRFFFCFLRRAPPLLLFLVGVALALFILLPSLRTPATRPRAWHRAPALRPVLGYFFALGAAYLVVEVVLMQRFVLFLGHPSYSISVTLAALLLCRASVPWRGRTQAPGDAAPRRARHSLAIAASFLLALDMHAPLLAPRAAPGRPAACLPARGAGADGYPFSGLGLLAARARSYAGDRGQRLRLGDRCRRERPPVIWGFRAVLLLGGALYLAAWAVTFAQCRRQPADDTQRAAACAGRPRPRRMRGMTLC
jgi:hypothetical protein